MIIATDQHGEFACEISETRPGGCFLGLIKFRKYLSGTVIGNSVEAVRLQFQHVCELIDAGGTLRRGVIMTGYHNGENQGDVLLLDGEVIGGWTTLDGEWTSFEPADSSGKVLEAPSSWMLHDVIADEYGDEPLDE